MAASNFSFLQVTEPDLYQLADVAEQVVHKSPATCLRELRTFGEMLTRRVIEERGIQVRAQTQHDRLVALQRRGMLPDRIATCLHQIRMRGNDASHENEGTHARAVQQLRNAWAAAVWYQENQHPGTSTPRPFAIPDRNASSKPRPQERVTPPQTKPERTGTSGPGRVQRAIQSTKSGIQKMATGVAAAVQKAGAAIYRAVAFVLHGIARFVSAVVRTVRRVIRWTVMLMVLAMLLFYLPTIYATGVGWLPEDTQRSLPPPSDVTAMHANVLSPETRYAVEEAAADSWDVIRAQSSAAVGALQTSVAERWTRWTEDETSD